MRHSLLLMHARSTVFWQLFIFDWLYIDSLSSKSAGKTIRKRANILMLAVLIGWKTVVVFYSFFQSFNSVTKLRVDVARFSSVHRYKILVVRVERNALRVTIFLDLFSLLYVSQHKWLIDFPLGCAWTSKRTSYLLDSLLLLRLHVVDAKVA